MLHMISLSFFSLLLVASGATIWQSLRHSRQIILLALGLSEPCAITSLPPRPCQRRAPARVIRQASTRPGWRAAA